MIRRQINNISIKNTLNLVIKIRVNNICHIKIINKDPFATLNLEKRLDYFMINYLGCEKLCVDNEQANLKEVVEEDWRLSQGDFDNIKNHVFKKQYFKSNKNNDHDHCNFCWTKITDLEIDEEHDTFGYVTLNAHGQEEWVCEKCFNDFKEAVIKFITSRAVIVSGVLMCLAAIMIYRLFSLQIINGEYYLDSFKLRIKKEKSIRKDFPMALFLGFRMFRSFMRGEIPKILVLRP